MSQIKTYSKTRPKSIRYDETDDDIFGNKDRKDDKDSNDKLDEEHINKRNKTESERSKMGSIRESRSSQGQLKVQNKISRSKAVPLKRKQTGTMPSPFKQIKRTQHKTRNSSKKSTDKSQKENEHFSWTGSDNNEECSEPSIEILRKDEGMTWQQKISFLLPKMQQPYVKNVNPAYTKTVQGKISSPILNISAENIEEEVSEDESEDYTYTWVTESATKSKSRVVQSTVPSTNYSQQHSFTVVAVDNSLTPSLKKTSSESHTATRTGKLKLSDKKKSRSSILQEQSRNEFLEKDQKEIPDNNKWNSTIQKNAQNIIECGFPVDISSIRMPHSFPKKTPIQIIQETTPSKDKLLKAPSRPRKKKEEKQLNSTKMFLSDHVAFIDMVPELSTINKDSEKADDSIEITRERSPFVKLCKAESPITPFVSPKKNDNEPVFTSTPTKAKDFQGKEFPMFDLSSVQIPEFDDDELEIHESREVNSQEIVCEPTEEEIDVPGCLEVMENVPCEKEVPLHEAYRLKFDKREDRDSKSAKLSHDSSSTKLSQNSTIKPATQNDSSKINEELSSAVPINLTVIPINHSSRSHLKLNYKPLQGKKGKKKRVDRQNLEECCIATFRVPIKPIRKSKTTIDYTEILKNTPIDCMENIF